MNVVTLSCAWLYWIYWVFHLEEQATVVATKAP